MNKIKIIIPFITFTVLIYSCTNSTLVLYDFPKTKECRESPETNNFVNIDKNDSSAIILKIGPNICAIFNENYPITLSPNYNSKSKRFTPTKSLIDSIEFNIHQQYWEAEIRWHKYRIFERENEIYIGDDSSNEKNKLEEFINYVAWANWESSRYLRLDRQCAGFINSTNQRILIIQFYDFCSDPYNLKEVFKYSWILGTSGWFGTNVKKLEYNIDTNRLNFLGYDYL